MRFTTLVQYLTVDFLRECFRELKRNKASGVDGVTVEDKIVQMGLKKILEAIFEADFLDVSFGFRPGRSDGRRQVLPGR